MKTVEHGTVSGYRHGCRQECCKEAKRAEWQDYKTRKKKEKRLDVEDQFEFDSGPNVMAFEGLDPEMVFLMVDRCWHYVKNGMPIPEATMRARRDVLAVQDSP